MKRMIAIMGGTFNPPHMGHLLGAQSVLEAYHPDRLLMIPTGTPPHKEMPFNSPSDEDRLNMLKLMVKGHDKIAVSDMEIKRGGKSYTVDTLHRLKELYPEADLSLIMGADMLFMIEQWYHFREIFKLCRLIVMCRQEHQQEKLSEACDKVQNSYGAEIELLAMEPFVISSSQIRKEIKNGKNVKQYLHTDVYRYIKEKNLHLKDG